MFLTGDCNVLIMPAISWFLPGRLASAFTSSALINSPSAVIAPINCRDGSLFEKSLSALAGATSSVALNA